MKRLILLVSEDRRFRWRPRQVLYKVRPIVTSAGRVLTDDYFDQLMTEYESEHGEDPMVIRDARGSLYLPHTGETIPLSTINVENYIRQKWQYNKIIVIEKEGFDDLLKDAGFAERHDCAIISSKGFSTRAIRDLIDKIAATDEPVTVFCVHDCDAPGTMIYQTLQEATKARPRRTIEVIDLGLNPKEAMELAAEGIVEIEPTHYKKRQPVGDHINVRDGEWLQNHRVELNAFTSRQLIDWLDKNMSKYPGKVIPPAAVLGERLRSDLHERVEQVITEQILVEGKRDERVARAMAELDPRLTDEAARLPDLVVAGLKKDARQHWTAIVATRAARLAEPRKRRRAPKE
jgi:hypothetical protein